MCHPSACMKPSVIGKSDVENPDHWAVDAVGAPHVGERTEKELITAFCDKIAELRPQLTLAYNPATKMSPWKR